jgi:hypothetical protein
MKIYMFMKIFMVLYFRELYLFTLESILRLYRFCFEKIMNEEERRNYRLHNRKHTHTNLHTEKHYINFIYRIYFGWIRRFQGSI